MSAQGAPQAKYCQDEGENLLLVEGMDDCHSIFHLADQRGLTGKFGIWAGGSDKRAVQKLSALLAGTALPARLGIVLDCDPGEQGDGSGLSRRWAQLTAKLEAFPYVLPESPAGSGTIVAEVEGYPRIGVWLMPDNEAEGMLEDFLLKLAPKRAAIDFAAECAKSARGQGWGNYKLVHESKAVAHTYLAWQDEPGKPLGLAVKSHQFDSSNPLADSFIQWLKDLFRAQEPAATA